MFSSTYYYFVNFWVKIHGSPLYFTNPNFCLMLNLIRCLIWYFINSCSTLILRILIHDFLTVNCKILFVFFFDYAIPVLCIFDCFCYYAQILPHVLFLLLYVAKCYSDLCFQFICNLRSDSSNVFWLGNRFLLYITC